MKRLVIALGGNALCRRGEPITVEVMRARVAEAASEIARACGGDDLVITHGNGPQVGLLALQAELSTNPAPLDVIGAESEGMIGFLLEEAMAGRMKFAGGFGNPARVPEGEREVVAMLTQVVVDADDPAFERPEKPVGALYSEAEARRLASARGWTIGPDGAGYRRLVASPEPRAIRELRAIEHLVSAHVVVVCAGGGGIPVVASEIGVRGVAAVVDKDLTASLLARELKADALVLLTDVDGVYDEWPGGVLLTRASPSELRRRHFARGSMQPKVEAACRFTEQAGRPAFIGALGSLEDLLAERAGTCVSLSSSG